MSNRENEYLNLTQSREDYKNDKIEWDEFTAIHTEVHKRSAKKELGVALARLERAFEKAFLDKQDVDKALASKKQHTISDMGIKASASVEKQNLEDALTYAMQFSELRPIISKAMVTQGIDFVKLHAETVKMAGEIIQEKNEKLELTEEKLKNFDDKGMGQRVNLRERRANKGGSKGRAKGNLFADIENV